MATYYLERIRLILLRLVQTYLWVKTLVVYKYRNISIIESHKGSMLAQLIMSDIRTIRGSTEHSN